MFFCEWTTSVLSKEEGAGVAYRYVWHCKHHQATENHHQHHRILEHLYNVERLERDEVALPVPRNEFDGVGKLNWRTRVQGCANGVG